MSNTTFTVNNKMNRYHGKSVTITGLDGAMFKTIINDKTILLYPSDIFNMHNDLSEHFDLLHTLNDHMKSATQSNIIQHLICRERIKYSEHPEIWRVRTIYTRKDRGFVFKK